MVERITAEVDSLDQSLRTPYRLVAVGPSQAGKSTLINILAGRQLLPTTGVGRAKTLKETRLTYSPKGDRKLRVRYLSLQEANQKRLFPLERFAEKVKLADGNDEQDSQDAVKKLKESHSDILEYQIKALIFPEIIDQEPISKEVSECIKEAKTSDWVDGWRLLLHFASSEEGQFAPTGGGRFYDLWEPRIEKISALIGTTIEYKEADCDMDFSKIIEQHTAGSLAFLVDDIEISLPSDSLKLLDVEDLPGVGNYGDPARTRALNVLRQAMQERSLDGILVVTRQNGLNQETGIIIKETGVLKRVLQGEMDLAVAITYADNMAQSLGNQRIQAGTPESSLNKNDLLAEVSKNAANSQRTLLKKLLEQQDKTMFKESQDLRLKQALENSKFIGVDAKSATYHCFRSWGSAPFADDLEGTQVPKLISFFTDRAQARHQIRLERAGRQTEHIRSAVIAALGRLVRDYGDQTAALFANNARKQYLSILEESKSDLALKWTSLLGSTKGKLDYLDCEIKQTRLNAMGVGQSEKARIIEGCKTAGRNGGMIHWATLQAALDRGGTWDGAHSLNLAGDLADALVPELLAGWRRISHECEKELKSFEKGTRDILSDLNRVAEKAANTAGLPSTDNRIIKDAESQLDTTLKIVLEGLYAKMDWLEEWVSQQLRSVLRDHTEEEFKNVRANLVRGRGVTLRMLNSFGSVGKYALVCGGKKGEEILQEALNDIRNQIIDNLFQNPVAFALDRLRRAVDNAGQSVDITNSRRALADWAERMKAEVFKELC